MERNVNQKKVMEHWKGNIENPLLSILCDTFNHENYIVEALEGFLSQETDFPFEIIVHDDASTDQTATIVKQYETQYPLIVKPILQQENQYSRKLNFWKDYTFPKAKGKYIAMCEGDDYWTDPLKLQKQVDFLENHEEVSITWTNFVKRWEERIEHNDFETTLKDIYFIDFNNIFNPYCTCTLTSVFRKSAVDIEKYAAMKYSKDNTLYSLALCKGKGAFLNFESAVYRQHAGGVFSLRSPFFQKYSSYLNMKEIYENLPKAKTENIKFIVDSLFKQSALSVLVMKAKNEPLDEIQKCVLSDFLKQATFSLRLKFFRKFIKMKLFKIFHV
jgi:glycosyltransferase involved in cell wall biosynthesis